MAVNQTKFLQRLAINGTNGVRKHASSGERGLRQRRIQEHAILDEKDYAAHVYYYRINPVKRGETLYPTRARCHIPYDYLPRRSYALFEARSLLQEIFGSSK
ncbi:protein of unknown function [Methylocaldum szegediense]|uniref:Transposase n=1 Tax=Methylocaldum szegediense TaxID=73780 RepID=A0ABM9HVX5_9GAMM|nr:protein of unknown function [Methylocaldum szegediense]